MYRSLCDASKERGAPWLEIAMEPPFLPSPFQPVIAPSLCFLNFPFLVSDFCPSFLCCLQHQAHSMARPPCWPGVAKEPLEEPRGKVLIGNNKET